MKTWNRVKKGLAFMTATAMLFALAACQQDGASSNAPPAGSQSPENSSSSGVVHEVSTDPVTLTAFSMQSVSTTYGIEDNWQFDKIKEDTGITLDWQVGASNVEEIMSTMLASGELPDIIGIKATTLANQALGGNHLLNLDQYKDIMPSVFEEKIYEKMVDYSRKYYSNDGNLYLLSTGVSSAGAIGATDPNWVPQLMYEQYKAVGEPEISTLEDYLDVVEQMVAQHPTTENGEKVYGFSLFSDWDVASAQQISTLSFLYGIDTEYVSTLMETNMLTQETKSLLDEDSFYKRALKFYFEANQRGLLDPDSMTQTFDTVSQKYSAGRVMFTYFSWMTGTFNNESSGHVSPTDGSDPNGYYAVFAKDMKTYDAPISTIGRPWFYAASSHSAHPDRCAQFLNWFYDPDNIFFMCNGPEGTVWEFDKNGEPYVTEEGWTYINDTEKELPEGGTFKAGDKWNTAGFGGGTLFPGKDYSTSYRYWDATLSRNPNDLKAIWQDKYGAVNTYTYLKENDMLAYATQAVNMITPASDDLQMVISQVGDKVKTYSWKMVYAANEEEFEALWDKMVSDAKALGIDQVTNYFTQQWNDALEIAKQYDVGSKADQ